MSDINTSKVDGNTVSASEFNQLAEIDNLISTSGQTPSTGNLEQQAIASARYSSAGNFFTDSGTANAYVLSPVSPFKSPVSSVATETYFNGMVIRFRAGNACSGASTVNVNNAGSKSLVKSDGSTALTTGDIPSNTEVEFVYNGTNFVQSIGKTPATTTTQGVAFLSNPITISNNATDANNDIDFSAGNFQFNDGSGQAVATAIMTKRLDATWSAGTNQGGLFSGTKAINTWYYPFKIYNPTTGVEDAGFDINSSGANIPSGFTKRSNNFQPIKTDGSGNILQGTFYKDGGFFYATRQTEESANDASATGNLTLSFVPPILAYAICLAYAQSNALNAYPHYYAGLSANNLIFQTAQLSAGNTRANGYIPTSNSVIYRQYGGDGNRTCTLFTNGFQLINFKI